MTPFKLTEKQCEQVIRDKPEDTYVTHLMKLQHALMMENEEKAIFRLQGQLTLLIEIMELKEKARNQLSK